MGENKIMLEPIHLNGYVQPDRAWVVDAVSRAVQAEPRTFIDQYKRDERSFGGRLQCRGEHGSRIQA